MSYAQAVPLSPASRSTAPATSNVVPLRSPRATVQVYLTGNTPGNHLFTLLHSPLGVYVTHTDTLRDSVRVSLDIAPEDFDFTLHTLMTTLPEATIGSIVRRTNTTVQ
ncbi:MAG TPA: hypothetical protein VL689_21325 [Paraburkholderia sp.]|jgi:hypothetical protein|nr:hypothetical protein [Paraburkholderia sp.]